jgi:dCMP deaminase
VSSIDRSELKDRTFLGVALQLAKLGTCQRKKVGAVITRDGRCVSWGFNGAPPGMPHCEGIHSVDDCRATHAEANALAAAARQGISTDYCTLYVTVSPCVSCARLLIAAGIVRVIWMEDYRDPEGTMLLDRAGIDSRVMLPVY